MEENQLWEILVPKTWNSGVEIEVDHHKRWDDFVRSLAGGLTILKKAKGVWESPDGVVFAEEMIPVRIACNENAIRTIGAFTMQHYNQLAVMMYLVSEKTIILHRSEIN